MAGKKYAIITGGSSGLGFAMAQKLAEKGYVPLLIARGKDKIEKAIHTLRKRGLEGEGFQGDVTSSKDLSDIFEVIKGRYEKIDFLILNAGVVHVHLLSDYTDYREMKEDIDIDLWGTILPTKIFMPLLRPGSQILMISSGLGLVGAAGYSTYCAAKAGVINFAEALRRELLCKGISVYVACPADIDTPQYEEERKSMPEWMKKATSARRSLLSPEEAAEKILSRCKGKRFLITINPEIRLLRGLNKILPSSIISKILDFSLPRPK